MIKTYYSLTKSGLVYGNVITVAAGFLLASRGTINLWLFLATLIGMSFVIASGCVFNNYIDRDIDVKMERTKDRALVKGLISSHGAIIFGIILGLVGFLVLALYTNILTVSVALAGFFVYIVLYSLWAKRNSVYGSLIGSISGATPPLVGYCAVSNHFDGGAVILFLILVLWQMPHFYAIAIRRYDEYAAAGIPVLPVKKGIRATKIQMLLYIIAFIVAALMLTVFGYTGYLYFTGVALLGVVWLFLCIKGFRTNDDKRWARKMFLFSLVVILGFSVLVAIGR